MNRRLILLVVVIALIAGFGALLHSPPSIIDAVTGATPKAKKAAQSSAQLEGSYIFCMNPLLDKLSDEDIREQLKAFERRIAFVQIQNYHLIFMFRKQIMRL